ncbi:MAG: glycine/sarcosine/betaine reductase selenoprotein B family protein, partial [Desulfuromonadales bacterium]|nr:glycine/sarcosine/betaine reductase selenoprotein B family protein [Desulfuromonadales bacterium]
MALINRIKNRLIAKVITRYPGLAQRFITAYQPWESGEAIPWSPIKKSLNECTLAVVTTSGIHHGEQEPFDMRDSEGDPSYRAINAATIRGDYRITHDYYDHSDAEKDMNIILPLDRLRELQQEGGIGRLAATH